MTADHCTGSTHLSAPQFVAESAAFRRTLDEARRFARSGSAPILIEGESGTGKTYLARHIHLLSPRAASAFRSVVLSTLDDALSSSDLFGHVAGAFTDARRARVGHFVASRGGTLFLDEIGKASRCLQGKLLHAVEYNEVTPVGSDVAARVDVRVLAATNIPLSVLTGRGEFLPDLTARFGFFRLRVPPLRERRQDIPGLIHQSLTRWSQQFGYSVPPTINPELVEVLAAAEWLTNLRGLDSAVQYILANADGSSELTLDHCGNGLDDVLGPAIRKRQRREPQEMASLVRATGSISAAARELGVPRSTVQRRIRKASTKPLGSATDVEMLE
ncbi:MAG: sigma 54-interacting transcriptional regulator [Gemmatimonadaceae bacterium]